MAAVQGVTVSADLPGHRRSHRVRFRPSRSARATCWSQLDTRQERAQLAAVEAQRELARLNFDRMRGLLNERVISQAEFDRATAEQKQTEARVGRDPRHDRAQDDPRAVFRILGIRQVNLGQYLAAGDPIVPLQSLNPIYVNFGVPQQDAGQMRVGRRVRITAEDVAGVEFARARHRDRLGRGRGHPQHSGAGDARQSGRHAAPGHVRADRGACWAPAARSSRCRRPRSATRRTATRSSS